MNVVNHASTWSEIARNQSIWSSTCECSFLTATVSRFIQGVWTFFLVWIYLNHQCRNMQQGRKKKTLDIHNNLIFRNVYLLSSVDSTYTASPSLILFSFTSWFTRIRYTCALQCCLCVHILLRQ